MKHNYAWLRRLPVLLGIGLSIFIGVGIWLLKDKFQKTPQTKRVVQQITVIPPPPPPPPPEQPPPPPPEVKEEKFEEPEPEKEPEPAPEEANEPPAEDLGLDAEGGAGSDGFGLQGRKGGRSLLGGAAGSAVIWYGGQVKRTVEGEMQGLLANTSARSTGYSVTIEVWIGPDGRISKAELVSGSSKTEVDAAIRNALPRLRASIGKAPPENMPQPLRIRLTSRI